MKTSKTVRARESTRSTLRNLNPVFHKRDKSEDNDAIPAALLKQAKSSGTLNLSGRGLAAGPRKKHASFCMCGPFPERRYYQIREFYMSSSASEIESNETDEQDEIELDDLIDNSTKNEKLPEKVFSINDPEKNAPVTLESLSIKEEDAWWNQIDLINLDLSSNRLTQLSPKIAQLNMLTVLMLYDNSLTSLPKEIAMLEKLNRINLSRNKLKELPVEFYTLPELRYLNLSHNELEELDTSISDLHMLEILDVSNNKIRTVPCGIGFLVRLTELYLSHNKICELPPDIVHMRCLQKIDLMHNELKTLPKDIGCLKKLQCIYVQHNNIIELPTFEGCQELQEIHISDNFIERIPRRLCVNLTHLKIFDIRDNKLSHLPEEIAFLKNLIRLDISNNSITQLPHSLGLLPHLVSLQVEGNPIKSIRRDILQCGTSRILKTLRDRSGGESISSVDLKKQSPREARTRTVTESSDEAINNMPGDGLNSPRKVGGDNAEQSIFPDKYSMRQSHCLNATMLNLVEVPDDIFQVAAEECVNSVDFSKNQLTTIPKGLSAMFNCATELVFANNAISEIPIFLSQFKYITMINVACNFLKDLPKEFGLLNTLRELNINNNRFEHIPSCIFECKALEILLARDNRIASIDATPTGLGALKRLAVLDLGNNYIDQVPPILGNLENIRSLDLIGNPFRHPRHQILQKGTDAVMSYLRDRIPK